MRAVVRTTKDTSPNSAIETGAHKARSAVLRVMRLRTTPIAAYVVVDHTSTDFGRVRRCRSGPRPTLLRIAAAMVSESAHDTTAVTRPDAVRVPLVLPPWVYAPHGAPRARAA